MGGPTEPMYDSIAALIVPFPECTLRQRTFVLASLAYGEFRLEHLHRVDDRLREDARRGAREESLPDGDLAWLTEARTAGHLLQRLLELHAQHTTHTNNAQWRRQAHNYFGSGAFEQLVEYFGFSFEKEKLFI